MAPTESVRVAGGRVRPRKAQLDARATAPPAPAIDGASPLGGPCDEAGIKQRNK
jgi:hypothetical protein